MGLLKETEYSYYNGNDFGGYQFNSAIKKDNIVGLQFHPERSGETGIYLLSKIISQITDGI